MNDTHDRRYYRTKQAIRSAFEELIQKKSVEDISVTELMEKADLDRRTFYLHYGCIFDVATEINREALEHLKRSISEMAPNDIESFFTLCSTIMMENFEYYRAVLTGTNSYQLTTDCIRILKEGLYDFFFENSGLTEETFDYYTEYIASGVTSEYIYWMKKGASLSVEEITKMVMDSVINSGKIIVNDK